MEVRQGPAVARDGRRRRPGWSAIHTGVALPGGAADGTTHNAAAPGGDDHVRSFCSVSCSDSILVAERAPCEAVSQETEPILESHWLT